MKIKLTLPILLLGGALSLTGCNTVHSMGQSMYHSNKTAAGSCKKQVGMCKKKYKACKKRDKKITEQVQYRLKHKTDLANLPIRVSTYKRVVMLKGRVNNHQQKRMAVKVAMSVNGVKGVRDYLRVR